MSDNPETSRAVLVIDDEKSILRAFDWVFKNENVRLLKATNAADGIEIAREHQPDVIVLDVNLPDLSGLDAYRTIREFDPKTPVVFITGRGTTDTAIEATKLGALNYLFKPLDLHKLRDVIHEAIDVSRRMHVPALVETSDEADDRADVLVGRCQAMNEVYQLIGRIAPLNDPVLILGESGTGKELVARAIWHHSERGDAPFLAVNCAAIPDTLLESELFGHEKGAFTGADHLRIGKFEQCSGGTLFLDEIGDMAPAAQAKILRVLQDQTFERVGGSQTLRADVRVIAATNRRLEELLPNAEFRSDLYYRLSVFSIKLPPLRDRGGDLSLLVEHFLRRFGSQLGKRVHGVGAETSLLLERYPWPGNVRELQSVLKQALLKTTGDEVTAQCLPPHIRTGPNKSSTLQEALGSTLEGWNGSISKHLQAGGEDLYRQLMAPVERHLITCVLQHCGGNQQQAAKLLGITRGTLRTKIRSLEIDVEDAKWSKFDQA